MEPAREPSEQKTAEGNSAAASGLAGSAATGSPAELTAGPDQAESQLGGAVDSSQVTTPAIVPPKAPPEGLGADDTPSAEEEEQSSSGGLDNDNQELVAQLQAFLSTKGGDLSQYAEQMVTTGQRQELRDMLSNSSEGLATLATSIREAEAASVEAEPTQLIRRLLANEFPEADRDFLDRAMLAATPFSPQDEKVLVQGKRAKARKAIVDRHKDAIVTSLRALLTDSARISAAWETDQAFWTERKLRKAWEAADSLPLNMLGQMDPAASRYEDSADLDGELLARLALRVEPLPGSSI